MPDIIFIALIVVGIAAFIFWNSRRARSGAVPSPAGRDTAPAAQPGQPAETGVSKYLKNLPPPPVETGVTRYLKKLPKPAPETGVTRYLKTLKTPAKPETGVTRYINGLLAAQAARRAEFSFEKLLASIPAPTRESGVTRYLKTVRGQ